MWVYDRYRRELLTLLIVAATVIGILEGFHIGQIALIKVAWALVSVSLLSVAVLKTLAVADSVFMLEAVFVSITVPPFIQPTVRFELLGVGLAVAFLAGAIAHRARPNLEPEHLR
ncbi:hypothetical protein [Halalkalirubrum salinum]|uniref:hypothetical protein n=1 Tax=Halalkalirubrum salinum TaxID=2563889 RepID=UPI0010FB28D4|nr:hypothetical protein [Halalkalirubrum salinum]